MAEEKKIDYDQKQIILVTGANKGIGLELCKMLVKNKGVFVILGCRNFSYVPKPKKEDAKRQPDNYEIINGKNDSSQTRIDILKNVRFKDIKNIDFVELDITNKESITKGMESIKEKYKKIDVLVNNAGIAFKGNAFDLNIVNTTLETNYIGTVNVTQTFLPLIKNGGRIIFTSSRAGSLNSVIIDKQIKEKLLNKDLTQNELENILTNFKDDVKNGEHGRFKRSAYGMSKVAMSAYSRILNNSQDIIKNKIFIAAYCPGWCSTYMSSGGGNRSAANGAKGLQLLCLEKKTLDVSGKFWGVQFDDDKNDNKTGKLINYSW